MDASRVYVIGHSNGGFMSYRMAYEHSDVVAAIVSLAGANHLEQREPPPNPVHILQIRGTDDTTIDPLLDSPYDERAATLSPDGNWLAYVSNETGADEVFVTPFPDADRKWQVSSGRAGSPLWAHDGRTLFYAGGGDMNAVDVDPGPPFVVGQPRVLFPLPTGVRQSPLSALGAGQFALTSDDQRFLMVRNVDPWATTAPPKLVLVQSFFEELRARAQGR